MKSTITPDFQALMDLCRISEEAREFHLGIVASGSSCGSYGCLLGNYAISGNDKRYRIHPECSRLIQFDGKSAELNGNLYGDAADRFGITLAESMFLFCEYDRLRKDNYYVDPNQSGYKRPWVGAEARSAAIGRVRKFIYYKLKKREFMYEEDGRVKESARRLEGNHGFAAQVIRESRDAAGCSRLPVAVAAQ